MDATEVRFSADGCDVTGEGAVLNVVGGVIGRREGLGGRGG